MDQIFRTICLSVNTRDCIGNSADEYVEQVRAKVTPLHAKLLRSLERLRQDSIAFRTVRLTISPVGEQGVRWDASEYVRAGKLLEVLAEDLDIEFIGGFSAFVERGIDECGLPFIQAIPEVLCETKRICSFLNVASSKEGINLQGIREGAKICKRIASYNGGPNYDAFAHFAVIANAIQNTPYMPMGYHCQEGYEYEIGIGPGGIAELVKQVRNLQSEVKTPSIDKIFSTITRTVTAIATKAESVGHLIAEESGIPLGTVDLSLGPLPNAESEDYSLLKLFQIIGIKSFSTPGSLALLAMLNDAVKRGALAGSAHSRGILGTFLSISEDTETFGDKFDENLSVDRLLALTTVCSVGLDMIAIPNTCSETTLTGLIADEMAVGCCNAKTTSVRIILADSDKPFKFTSNSVFGETRAISFDSPHEPHFVNLPGVVPPPIQQFRN